MTAMVTRVIAECVDLSVSYPGKRTPALDAVNLTLSPGEVVVLLGKNGAGKSTAIGCLTGQLRPTTGEVRLHGQRLLAEVESSGQRALRATIGFVPDRPDLPELLTGAEYLALVGASYGVARDLMMRRTEPLVDDAAIRDVLHRPIGQYSHGMRQKLLLAATLACEPTLLVLDEPIIGLDPPSARWMQTVLRRYAQAGNAVLFSTHLLALAVELADRLVVLDDGKKIADGPVAIVVGASEVSGAAALESIFFGAAAVDVGSASDRISTGEQQVLTSAPSSASSLEAGPV